MKPFVPLLAAIAALSLGCPKRAPAPTSAPADNKNFKSQTQLYEIYKTTHADVVMLGDSITFGVQWNELLGREGIVNRGIVSDSLEGFLARLEYVTRLKPRLCLVMGGVNDVFDGLPVDTVFERYRTLLTRLRQAGITPVIQSTLLTAPPWKNTEKQNPRILELDEKLAAYARAEGIDYVDLNAALSRDGRLRPDVTGDGVHLNAQGYLLWRQAIEPVLQAHGL